MSREEKNRMLINAVLGCIVCFVVCCFSMNILIGAISGICVCLIKEFIEDGKYANFDIENIVSAIIGSVIGVLLYFTWIMKHALFNW